MSTDCGILRSCATTRDGSPAAGLAAGPDRTHRPPPDGRARNRTLAMALSYRVSSAALITVASFRDFRAMPLDRACLDSRRSVDVLTPHQRTAKDARNETPSAARTPDSECRPDRSAGTTAWDSNVANSGQGVEGVGLHADSRRCRRRLRKGEIESNRASRRSRTTWDVCGKLAGRQGFEPR